MEMRNGSPRERRTLRDILRDPFWQFVGAIISIIAVVLTVYTLVVERDVKKLRVSVLACSSLVQVEEEIAERVEIKYGDKPVDNVSLVQVRLENHGRREIREEDYARPFEFVFPKVAEIVRVDVVESKPSNLDLAIWPHNNRATLSTVLLNGGDRATIKFLVVNLPTNHEILPFEINARIAGVKQVSITSFTGEDAVLVPRIASHPLGLLLLILSTIVISFAGGYLLRPRLDKGALKASTGKGSG